MPTNALTNPLVLPILGLLAEGHRHRYAVFTGLRDRYDYLAVRNGTVYTLLDRLVRDGWVDTARGGTTGGDLAITRTGRRALADCVTRQLREADLAGTASFGTALAYLGILPPQRAVELLTERRAQTVREIERLDAALRDAGDEPEVHMIEAHWLRSRLWADARWLRETARRIDAGELAWR